jgi:hypothetical protein
MESVERLGRVLIVQKVVRRICPPQREAEPHRIFANLLVGIESNAVCFWFSVIEFIACRNPQVPGGGVFF